MRIAIALLLFALAGCGRGRSVTSCRDSLAGVWRDDASGNRYHVVANQRGYEMYAMWNSAVAPDGAETDGDAVWAPLVFDFAARPGGGLAGTRSQRVERAGQPCTLRTRATISSCAGGVLQLELEQPTAVELGALQAGANRGANAAAALRLSYLLAFFRYAASALSSPSWKPALRLRTIPLGSMT